MTKTAMSANEVSRSYLSDPQHFAQICNNTLFGGQQLIRPEGLRDRSTIEAKTDGTTKKEIQTIWKERDLLMQYEDQAVFVILGVENQTDVHYCMPLRGLLYDALNYEEQRRRIQKKHREKKDLEGTEFVSGFSKNDRLIPVFTIVVYYGSDEWDGARSLHELLDIPEKLMPYKAMMTDYRIHLLDIQHMENLEQYTGELKGVLGFLKYQKDKDQLRNFVHQNSDIFSSISYESKQAISVLSKFGKAEQYFDRYVKNSEDGEEKKVYDMCKALDDIWEERWQVGKSEGIKEGIKAVIKDNLDQNVPKEKIRMKLQKLFALSEQESLEYMNEYCI